VSDDIENKLNAMQKKREELHRQLADTSDVLSDVESKFSRIKGATSAPAGIPSDTGKRTEEALIMKLVPKGLSQEDVTVRPGEKFADSVFLFSEAINENTAAVSLKDADGRFIYANRALHNFYQAEWGKIVGTRDADWSDKKLAKIYLEKDKYVIDARLEHSSIEPAERGDGVKTHWYTHRFPATSGRRMLVASIAIEVGQLLQTFDESKTLEIAKARVENMETLKHQLLRLATRFGEEGRI
jgi:hypothetical protein